MLHSIASFQVCEFPSLFSALDSLLLQSRSGNFSREFSFLIHPPKSPAFDLQRHLNYLTVKFPQWKKNQIAPNVMETRGGNMQTTESKLEKIYITLRQIRN